MGNMMNMLSQLKAVQKKVEELQKQMDHHFVIESNSEGTLKVKVNLNNKIDSLEIGPEWSQKPQELSPALQVLINDALQKAKTQHDQLMAEHAQEGMPDLSSLMGGQ